MNPGQHFLLLLLAVYRLFVSPLKAMFFGPAGRCRYSPSCSQYASEAVRRHGVFRGSILTGARLARCHPWGGCGCDPVPDLLKTKRTDPAGKVTC